MKKSIDLRWVFLIDLHLPLISCKIIEEIIRKLKWSNIQVELASCNIYFLHHFTVLSSKNCGIKYRFIVFNIFSSFYINVALWQKWFLELLIAAGGFNELHANAKEKWIGHSHIDLLVGTRFWFCTYASMFAFEHNPKLYPQSY